VGQRTTTREDGSGGDGLHRSGLAFGGGSGSLGARSAFGTVAAVFAIAFGTGAAIATVTAVAILAIAFGTGAAIATVAILAVAFGTGAAIATVAAVAILAVAFGTGAAIATVAAVAILAVAFGTGATVATVLAVAIAVVAILAVGTGQVAQTILEFGGKTALLANDGVAHFAEDGLDLEDHVDKHAESGGLEDEESYEHVRSNLCIDARSGRSFPGTGRRAQEGEVGIEAIGIQGSVFAGGSIELHRFASRRTPTGDPSFAS